jgi:hypothetical protein
MEYFGGETPFGEFLLITPQKPSATFLTSRSEFLSVAALFEL